MKDITDSVIARLLGFDELRTSHKPIRGKCKVLSERYVRNASSVSIRPRSLVSTGRSCSTKNEIENGDALDKRVDSSASKLKNDGVQSPKSNVLRFLQKYERDSFVCDLDIDYLKKSLEFKSVLEDVKWDRHSGQGYREHEKALKPERGNKEPVCNAIVSCRHICVACTRAMDRISQEERHRSKFDELSRTGHCLLDQSSLANKSRKRNLERWKTAKGFQEVGVRVRGQNHDKTLALTDNKSIPSLSSSCSPVYSSIGVLEDGYLKSLPPFKPDAIKKVRSNGKQGGSNVQEVSVEEAFLNKYSEEESSDYSTCSRICPKRTFQQSPDSVLEQFHMQNSSTFEHFNSIGLQSQLEFDSEDTYSEGSVVLLSGNDDFVAERFNDFSHSSRIVKTWLGDNKSRNSSYMVDVLDEAGPFMDINTWYSLDCPICPSVFEVLEKKYGKQTSWERSERLLLFDRINLGLVAILSPVINSHACETCIRSRVCACLKSDEVEDELWMMLIIQDEEMSDDLSDKALDKWFVAEEAADIICVELEYALFDELTMELASLWDLDE
ncbi:hypothetical protein CASFOL_002314 [Castilleja foliolosa]|uniref:DUF4378 domain-containing protein n=1 Tax=Castilleja foliolosa TaxID=1961234 RepID=A0ABD3EDX5_9LAMI